MHNNLKINETIVPKSGLGRVVGVTDREVVVEFQSTLTGKTITKKFNAETAEKMGVTFPEFMDKFFSKVVEVQ